MFFIILQLAADSLKSPQHVVYRLASPNKPEPIALWRDAPGSRRGKASEAVKRLKKREINGREGARPSDLPKQNVGSLGEQSSIGWWHRIGVRLSWFGWSQDVRLRGALFYLPIGVAVIMNIRHPKRYHTSLDESTGQAVEAHSRIRRHWRRLVLVALGLVVGLVICELCLRMYDACWIGFRYRNPPNYIKDAGNLRIALLGESVANGFPYREGSLGYEKLGDFNLLTLTQILLKEELGCRNVVIENYALGGIRANAVIQRYWTLAKYKPNALVIYCGNNEFPCSYKDRAWRPRSLWHLGRLKVGALLLRWFNVSNFVKADPRPSPLTQDLLVPAWELEFNRDRYRQCIDSLLKHCRQEGITAIVVIPEANHLLCPQLSIYHGPPDREEEAVRLFKEAFYRKHFAGNELRAREIMEELVNFCGFAHLYFELGETYYREGHFDKAHHYLHAAIETDLFPPAITETYKRELRDLAAAYGVPCIDTAEVLARRLGKPVPDNACFLDSCHLTMAAYAALSREIVQVLEAQSVVDAHSEPASNSIQPTDPSTYVRGTRKRYQSMCLMMPNAVIDTDFIKLYHIQRGIDLLKSESFMPLPHPPEVAAKVVLWERLLQQEREKLLEWSRRSE
jgi:hypothetical protein